jgi:hypothetical protein
MWTFPSNMSKYCDSNFFLRTRTCLKLYETSIPNSNEQTFFCLRNGSFYQTEFLPSKLTGISKWLRERVKSTTFCSISTWPVQIQGRAAALWPIGMLCLNSASHTDRAFCHWEFNMSVTTQTRMHTHRLNTHTARKEDVAGPLPQCRRSETFRGNLSLVSADWTAALEYSSKSSSATRKIKRSLCQQTPAGSLLHARAHKRNNKSVTKVNLHYARHYPWIFVPRY